VIGGGCMAPGFMDRLKNDLVDLLSDESEPFFNKLPKSGLKFFKAPVKANIAAWLGGIIFSLVFCDFLNKKLVKFLVLFCKSRACFKYLI